MADAEEPLVAIVEIPKGSSNKYEWDEELGAIKLDRLLFASLGYPTDYGFFKNTLAADGDPLDVMIVVSEPTFPGCHIEVKPVALFRMRDEKAEDNKILCVPFTDPNWSHVDQLDDLPMTLRDEISHFFSIYKTPEWKVVRVDGWYPREDALESIERAEEALAGEERLALLLGRHAGPVGPRVAQHLPAGRAGDDPHAHPLPGPAAQVHAGPHPPALAEHLHALARDRDARPAHP